MKLTRLCVAAALAAARIAHADTFHVTATGDDGAAGSSAAPWRTIQRAASAVRPGDTVIVHAGRYAGFEVAARGTEGQPIAFVADGEVAIDGAATANRDAILIDGGAWIRIEGFTVTGATRAGIAALECDHITVARNRVDQNGKWGVFSAFCDDLAIEDNEASRSGEQHGIYASNSADRPVIRRNRIWGNAMAGIHINGDITQGGDGVISNAIVEDNVIYDNGRAGGSGINCDGVVGAVIRDNLLDGNHASGISLYQIDGGAPSTGNQVINNTIRMASDARWAVNIQDGATGNVLRNNILLHPSASRGAIDLCAACTSGLVSDHNAVVGRFSIEGTTVDLAGWRARTGGDAASFVATEAELFVDPAGGDLHLRAGSPAIDRGAAQGAPSHDVVGTARPQGAAVDIGAYERCDGACASAGPGGGGGDGTGGGPGAGDGQGGGLAGGSGGGCSTRGAQGGALGWLGLAGIALLRRVRARRS
ncbi:MAG TPA: right-handed parallel beta-helix repeat-containing protein [Kofleriaceae bacterium]|nr:right-handed parallel beta-helix repeat-containing protein [Kofleriaceae bacterium]